MRRLLSLLVGLLVLVGVAAASSGGATQAQPRWVITDLGVPSGYASSDAVAVNDRGQVVMSACQAPGSARTCSPVGFLWEEGRTISLETLGGHDSRPAAVNDDGQIIGTSLTKRGERHAFLWGRGRMRDLGTLGGRQSVAAAITSSGLIVGWSRTKSGSKHACLWAGGEIRDLGTLGGANSEAVAVNDRGQIVGWSESNGARKGGSSRRVVVWEKGIIRDLGLLDSLDNPFGTVAGINERGEVAWTAQTDEFESTGILWRSGRTIQIPMDEITAINDSGWVIGAGGMSGEGNLWWRGHVSSLSFEPKAINNRGLVVGWRSGKVSGQYIRATAWQNGKRRFLPTLGSGRRISRARAVSSTGLTVGESEYHAVLWTLKR